MSAETEKGRIIAKTLFWNERVVILCIYSAENSSVLRFLSLPWLNCREVVQLFSSSLQWNCPNVSQEGQNCRIEFCVTT